MTGNADSTIEDRLVAAREHLDGRQRRQLLTGVLFALPYLLLFAVFLLYPLLKGLYMSLFDWNYLEPSESTFIGLDNYARMLQDPNFWNALWNTVEFVVLTVPLILVVSLVLALGLNRELKGSRLLRFVYFSPYVLTIAVVALVWTQMFAQDGALTHMFGWMFEGSPLNSTVWAMPSIVLTTVWWQAGFYFAILLAARQNVPERLYEAARLDGAGPWRTFWDITLPHMQNAVLFVVVAATIFQFQVFGQPYLMTDGGPAGNTETLVLYLYELGFERRNLGFAAAVGYALLVILIGVSVLNYYLVGLTDE